MAVVNLRNATQTACWLYGYPTVQLLSRGTVVPFSSGIGGYYVPDQPALVQLTAIYHNLVRKWGET